MVNQLKGEFEAKDPIMSKYLEKAKAIIIQLDYFDIQHVPREKIHEPMLSTAWQPPRPTHSTGPSQNTSKAPVLKIP